MHRTVYAHRQWVIFLFINEWADLGKGSSVDYSHNPTGQASSLKGLFPHWHVLFSLRLGLQLMVVPICLLNFGSEDPSSFHLQDLLCSRELSFVHSRCSCFSLSPSPLTRAWQSLYYPSHRNVPTFELWSDHTMWDPCPLFSENSCVSLGTMLRSALLLPEVFLASLSSDHSIPQVCVGFGQSPFNNTLVLWLICNCFRGGVLIASWGCLLICERPSCEFSKIFSFSLAIKNTYIRTPYSQ